MPNTTKENPKPDILDLMIDRMEEEGSVLPLQRTVDGQASYGARTAMSGILSAIRGPDSSSSQIQMHLKALVTSRIRGMIMRQYNGQISHDPLVPADIEHLAEVLRAHTAEHGSMGEAGWRHYTQHLTIAIGNTPLHPVWGGLSASLTSVIFQMRLPTGWEDTKSEWKKKNPPSPIEDGDDEVSSPS